MTLKIGDLKYLVSTKVHFDSYESKMGQDENIITFSFKLLYRSAAEDLTNFLEKGYDWILDADVSAGTLEDGKWLVFVETPRRPSVPKAIIELLKDLEGITEIKATDYQFMYRDIRNKNYQPLTLDVLETMPLSPRDYKKRNQDPELSNLINSAGINQSNPDRKYAKDIEEFVNLSRYR